MPYREVASWTLAFSERIADLMRKVLLSLRYWSCVRRVGRRSAYRLLLVELDRHGGQAARGSCRY